ncbi:hypothetical protein ND748_29495, partial [Frankia sp. AiPs1]|nr:hypothetical protein [Frankia sp. AiPs1]
MWRAVSGLVDDSTRTTVAPKSARARPTTGPATTHDRSSTRSPLNGAGAGAGRRLGSPGGHPPGGDAPAASLREALSALDTRGGDPDFIAGFYDALGPAGLAHLLAGVAGRSRGPMVNRPAPPSEVNRREADGILGRTFAAYSRSRTFDDSWLGRFNTRGRHDRADTVLLTPLLAAGRIDGALLDRLGRLAFGPGSGPAAAGPAVSEPAAPEPRASAAGSRPTGATSPAGPAARRAPATGQVAGGLRNATADRDYRVALLTAISGEPRLAARFATRYVEAVLAGAALAELDLPVAAGLDDATSRAWSG